MHSKMETSENILHQFSNRKVENKYTFIKQQTKIKLIIFWKKPKNNEKTIETENQIKEKPSNKQLHSGNNR